MNNRDLALSVLLQLYKLGTRHLVLCPGGRNAPLTEVLAKGDHPFSIHTHFDERAASFYALGLSQSENAPVAVITTSGTAVSETLSACIEAYYSSTALVVVSADRPQSYRGSGAPQAIRQIELLEAYCSQVHDLQSEPLDLQGWDIRSPLHINVCFDEPLVDHEAWNLEDGFWGAINSQGKEISFSLNDGNKAIADFFSEVKKPLIIVSGSFGFDHHRVKEALSNVQIPIFLESTSGLKAHPLFKNTEIEFPELLTASGAIDGIIRIGHVPTHRAWRDLEALKLPVLNFSHNPFSGLSWERAVLELRLLETARLQEFRHEKLESIRAADWEQRQKRDSNLLKFPLSEPALIRSLQELWKTESLVYLGNSLPIREWDYVNSSGKNFTRVAASRGANGIDGQISTFFGHAFNETESLGVFGDLTSLYDMSAPWFLKYIKGISHIAVINNGGGMIFDRMFGKEIYLNRHQLSFESLAGLWDMEYRLFGPSINSLGNTSTLIEVRPDATQTKAFWEAMK